jgi:uncharacterized Zn-binding protein involved in type VI secretion
MAKRKVALLGDTTSHGGTINVSNQDGTVKAEGKEVLVKGASFYCPVDDRIAYIVSNLDDDLKVNGKEVVLDGSVADCGATVIASSEKTFGS